jgi:hypothetical protein
MNGYAAYILTEDKRQTLLKVFEPEFSKAIAHHITYEYGVEMPKNMPKIESVELTHHISDGNGLEVLCVKINGEEMRADGKRYHITWSLDPEAALLPSLKAEDDDATTYKPRHANNLIALALGDDCPDEFEVTELDCKFSGDNVTAVYVEDDQKQTPHIIPMKKASAAPAVTAGKSPAPK